MSGQNRLRLLMGANALVYLGPLLAGMAGFGWALLPFFAGILIFWLVLLDPRGWVHSRRDWITGRAAIRVAGQVLMQVLLVAVLFGAGRGIAGVMGLSMSLPAVQLLALSFFALPATRLIWRPEERQVEQAAERMVARMVRLPEGCDNAELLAHLAAMRRHASADDLEVALRRAIDAGAGASVAARALAMLAVSRGRVAEPAAERGAERGAVPMDAALADA